MSGMGKETSEATVPAAKSFRDSIPFLYAAPPLPTEIKQVDRCPIPVGHPRRAEWEIYESKRKHELVQVHTLEKQHALYIDAYIAACKTGDSQRIQAALVHLESFERFHVPFYREVSKWEKQAQFVVRLYQDGQATLALQSMKQSMTHSVCLAPWRPSLVSGLEFSEVL